LTHEKDYSGKLELMEIRKGLYYSMSGVNPAMKAIVQPTAIHKEV